ncbi:unnamed protein product [Victoria cruziana]
MKTMSYFFSFRSLIGKEFDWEAAVKEIDDACERVTLASTAAEHVYTVASGNQDDFRNEKVPSFHRPKSKNGARQSTLDGFAGSSKKFGDGGETSSRATMTVDDGEKLYVNIDAEMAKTWIYPVNVPLRDYQFSIVKTALFSNTLVALPTGLGKTLIAAVVMYNYFRWFPRGKIVFAAPSRPLVLQQIEACHNIVGIPQEWTIDMTGQMSPSKRSSFWETKRVFFVTPQVLEKDIQSGRCLMMEFVCLVIDEAHRALGNYSYCTAVRELTDVPVQIRILALTATPGSKKHTIQNVIDNLHISVLEYRNESDNDVKKYMHDRRLELIEVAMSNDAVKINSLLLEAIQPFVSRLCGFGVLQHRDLSTFSPCALLNLRDRFRQYPPASLPQEKYGEAEGYFGVLITLYYIRKLLSSHGTRPAYEMLQEKMQQGDIMESLSKLEDFVKATEFIGQSSGKSLKGQSQKVQQAVLQKFRTGGYNVIVATSIGEEGLDIMEVDLVICFDANISPLRMIQRMGRTGRKHHGRVVILACEGNELEGYLNKQAKAKAVGKHMHNGGTNSFIFHSSPRMVPHIYKPEVHFVELSIEKFIPRGRKVKEDLVKRVPCLNLSASEIELLRKYFHSGKEDKWRPSLIAFPHFQVFPSRVQHVRHSYRTMQMLIDSMQLLQEVGSLNANRPISDCKASLSGPSCVQDVLEPQANVSVDESVKHDCPTLLETKFNAQPSVEEVSQHNFQQYIPGISSQRVSLHHFLFSTGFLSVTAVGSICISYVPSLPSSKGAGLGISLPDKGPEMKALKQERSPFRAPSMRNSRNGDAKHEIESHNFTYNSPIPSRRDSDKHECLTDISDVVPQTPMVESESPIAPIENATDKILLFKSDIVMPASDLKDLELSPRLTNLIERGVVPETPTVEPVNEPSAAVNIVNTSLVTETGGCSLSTNHLTTSVILPRCCAKLFSRPECIQNLGSTIFSLVQPELDSFKTAFVSTTQKFLGMENSEGVSDNRSMKLCCPSGASSPTPTRKQENKSCSEEWQLIAGDVSSSVHQPCRLKRLRRYRDIGKTTPHRTIRTDEDGTSLDVDSNRTKPVAAKVQRGKMISQSHVNDFFDEEAEVSSDVDVSEDEREDCEGPEINSFIDDGVDSTIATTRAKAGETDMIAFYRRSLLSQSPLERHLNFNGSSPIVTISEGRSVGTDSCEKASDVNAREIEQPNCRNRIPCEVEERRTSVNSLASGVRIGMRKETDGKIFVRKRKLDYQSVPSLYAADICIEGNGSDTSFCQDKSNEPENDTVFDDQFYEGLDLDEIEAKATEMLQNKSESTLRFTKLKPSLNRKEGHDLEVLCSPFDLGV